MNTQYGGLEPLLKVPKFKYTFDKKRKLFIGYVYPYADHFINFITSIPYEKYSYTGNCEYYEINEDNFTDIDYSKEVIKECSSTGYPLYLFSGGCAYELLNKQFNNINLHKYCDATGDIDVSLYPPKITQYNEEKNIFFFKANNTISSFYSNFTTWVFQNMVKNIRTIQSLFDSVPGFVNFSIDEYDDIPNHHKKSDLGYKIEMMGKLCLVAFLNEDNNMFKIQVICKIDGIQDDEHISSVDHIIEIIIPLPLPDTIESFCPSHSKYKQNIYETILINGRKYNIDKIGKLIDDNKAAYLSRVESYDKTNERDIIHKPINHIARLFYLYELIYQNQSSYDFKDVFAYLNLVAFIPGQLKEKSVNRKKLQELYYYKIVNNEFYTIKVDTRFFLNAYLELIVKDKYTYNNFKRNNPTYFIDDTNTTNIQNIHNRFITELFNDDLFEPLRILTFKESTGGKRRKKTLKSMKVSKKIEKIKLIKEKRKNKLLNLIL